MTFDQCFELSVSFFMLIYSGKHSLFSEMLILGVLLKLGMILNLTKIQRWSKLGNGSEVRNSNKKVTINNVGTRDLPIKG